MTKRFLRSLNEEKVAQRPHLAHTKVLADTVLSKTCKYRALIATSSGVPIPGSWPITTWFASMGDNPRRSRLAPKTSWDQGLLEAANGFDRRLGAICLRSWNRYILENHFLGCRDVLSQLLQLLQLSTPPS